MWPGFDSQIRRQMWVEFVGSLLCTESWLPLLVLVSSSRGFSPEVSVSMLHSKALPFQVVLNCWAFDVPVKMLLDLNEGFPSERITLFFAFNSCLATCMIISCKRLCLFIVLKYNHCISFEFNNCVEFRGVIFCLSCLLSRQDFFT